MPEIRTFKGYVIHEDAPVTEITLYMESLTTEEREIKAALDNPEQYQAVDKQYSTPSGDYLRHSQWLSS